MSGNLSTPRSVNFGPGKSLPVSQLIANLELVLHRKFNYEISSKVFKEASWLELDSHLAKEFFGWEPFLNPEESIFKTGKWYSNFLVNGAAEELMLMEIDQYRNGKF
jgi:UDP-glucose 4-epimerase